MENTENILNDTAKSSAPHTKFKKTKTYQDFINILSQIISKHGAEVLSEISRTN